MFLNLFQKKNIMQKLAKREEQIMQALWQLGRGFVKEVIEELPAPKPHYNTVSTIIRVLEDKGFVGHKKYGNTFQYYPIISKDAYPYSKMVTYFAKEEKISEEDLQDILKIIKKKKEE